MTKKAKDAQSKKTKSAPSLPAISLKFNGNGEEEFFNHTKKLYRSAESSLLTSYWWIGKNIIRFYKKEYGKETLKTIAEKTGIDGNTLSKACKFARQYSKEQVEELTTGEFPLSWRIISHNLTIKSENVMKTYRKSDSPKTFCASVTKLKPRTAKKGSSDQPAGKPNLKAVKPANQDKAQGKDLGFDGRCEYRSKKKDLILTLDFIKDKVKSIDAESVKTAIADILKQLGKKYIVSVKPASKPAHTHKKRVNER